MAERTARVRAFGQRARSTDAVGDQRANNVIYGHLGRLAYTPAETDDGIGELDSNRSIRQTPSLQEVSPFQSWYPSTRPAAPARSLLPYQETHAQKNWLLKTIPSAFLGNTGIQSLLSDELRSAAAPAAQSPSSLPLLSYGEITDIADPVRPKGCPAIAMAVGDAGHIVRIAKLQHSKWKWAEDDGVSLHLATAASTEEGHWCGDSVPITQIKFVPHGGKSRSQSRWLLVQTAAATAVFEPVLHRVPIADQHSSCGYVAQGPSYIATNRILTLAADQTGGNPQCDVSFNPEAGHRPPQLAIIDQAGNWSVWNIHGNRHTAGKRPSCALHKCGNFHSGPLNGLPVVGVESYETYRIMWLGAGTSSAPGSPSNRSRSASQEAPSQPGSLAERSDLILLCDRMTLKTFEVESGGERRALRVVGSKKTDRVVDVHPCPIDPSLVFVLTSVAVVLLSPATPGAPGSRYDRTVLLSCPHLRDTNDETLKLSVCPIQTAAGHYVRLIFVYSSIEPRVTVFWFTVSGASGLARFHQQPFQFTRPSRMLGSGGSQLQTILPLPRSFVAESGETIPSLGLEYSEKGVQFLQVIALGTDFSLDTALCSSAYEKAVIFAPTIQRDITRPINKRKAALRYYGNSFVVPDDFDELTILHPPDFPGAPRPVYQPTARKKDSTILDLSHVIEALSARVSRTVYGLDDDNASMVSREEKFEPIREAVEIGIQHGYLPLSTLLSLAADKYSMGFPDDTFGLTWANLLDRLVAIGGERFRVFHLTRNGETPELARLFQTLLDMWSAHLPRHLLDAETSHNRKCLFAVIAWRLFLSQVAVMFVHRRFVAPSTPRSEGMVVESSSPRSGLLTPSSSDIYVARSSSLLDSPEEEESDIDSWAEKEDDAVTRLRQYATFAKSPVPKKEAESRILSHWEVGTDPSTYVWSTPGSKSDAEEEAKRRKKKDEARRRRRAEKLGLGRTETEEASSQPLVPRIQSSQPQSSQARPQESQLSGGSIPSQVMSQPAGGPFSARPKKKQQRAKKVFGFK